MMFLPLPTKHIPLLSWHHCYYPPITSLFFHDVTATSHQSPFSSSITSLLLPTYHFPLLPWHHCSFPPITSLFFHDVTVTFHQSPFSSLITSLLSTNHLTVLSWRHCYFKPTISLLSWRHCFFPLITFQFFNYVTSLHPSSHCTLLTSPLPSTIHLAVQSWRHSSSPPIISH